MGKVILTLIRRFPEALDLADNDGDTPRLCIRKGLDPTAKNTLMMPSHYWTKLFSKAREKDNSSAVIEEKDKEINSLKRNLSVAEETLAQVKKSEEVLIKKVNALEHRLRKMELNAFDIQKPGSLNSRITELSDKVLRIEDITVSSNSSFSAMNGSIINGSAMNGSVMNGSVMTGSVINGNDYGSCSRQSFTTL